MDTLHGWSDQMLDTAVHRLHGVSGGLMDTAYSYVGIDQNNRDRMNDVPDNHRPDDAGGGTGITFSSEGSPFSNPTAVTPAEISADGPSITESMDSKMRGSVEADAINWVVRNFSEALGLGGWSPATGPARPRRRSWSILKIATKCAQIFDRLIGKVIDVGKRFVPVVGQIAMLVEWIASGFEDFPFWDDIHAVADMIQEIITLQETVSSLMADAQAYVAGFEQAVAAVQAIPQIDSVEGAATTAGQFREGAEQMKQARASFDQNAGKFQQQLDNMAGKAPK
jgi:hypothetical protein